MTSEVVILNRSAVALAADSATTIGDDEKVFTTTRKIYRLSNNLPIAVMIYGNTNFMFTPWEVIISIFNKTLRGKTYPKLKDYVSLFLSFLNDNKLNMGHEEQIDFVEKWVKESIVWGLVGLDGTSLYTSSIEYNTTEKKFLFLPDKFNKSLKEYIHEIKKKYNNEPDDPIFLEDEKLPDLINSAVDTAIKQITINKNKYEWIEHLNSNNKKLIKEYFVMIIKKKLRISNDTDSSGLVFAGFGEDEIYPSIDSYSILGLFNNKLKYEKIEEKSNSVSSKQPSIIISFAQSDVINTLLYGVDPKYFDERWFIAEGGRIADLAINNFSEGIKEMKLEDYKEDKKFIEFIKKFRDEDGDYKEFIFKNYIKYYFDILLDHSRTYVFKETLRYVDVLPKDELAKMAENLITITSIKRMTSEGIGTVAGPTDVVLLSKKDGFVWIKKKESFDSKLNPHSNNQNIF